MLDIVHSSLLDFLADSQYPESPHWQKYNSRTKKRPADNDQCSEHTPGEHTLVIALHLDPGQATGDATPEPTNAVDCHGIQRVVGPVDLHEAQVTAHRRQGLARELLDKPGHDPDKYRPRLVRRVAPSRDANESGQDAVAECSHYFVFLHPHREQEGGQTPCRCGERRVHADHLNADLVGTRGAEGTPAVEAVPTEPQNYRA